MCPLLPYSDISGIHALSHQHVLELPSRGSGAEFTLSEAGSSRSEEPDWATLEGQDTLTARRLVLCEEVHSGAGNIRASQAVGDEQASDGASVLTVAGQRFLSTPGLN